MRSPVRSTDSPHELMRMVIGKTLRGDIWRVMIGHRSLKEGGGGGGEGGEGGERSSQGGCAEIPSVIDVPPSTLNLLVSIYWG